MKRFGFMFLFSIFIIMLQQAIFSRFQIFNVTIDIVFVYMICFSLIRDDYENIIVALFTGIVRDSFLPGIFGVNTVLYIVTAYILSQVQKRIYKDAAIIPMLLTLVFTVFKSLLYFSYFYIAGMKFDFRQHVIPILSLESIYNSLTSIFIYGIVKKIGRTRIMHKDWRF